MPKRTWDVDFHPECETWANDLPQPDKEALLAAVRVLESDGPMLGRPLVDTITGSKDWQGWYVTSIPIADRRFDEHQARVKAESTKAKKSGRTKGKEQR